MTTGWGAPDPAPSIAYELAAAVAGDDDAEVSRLWDSLDGPGRAHVLAALGAQARHAAALAGDGNRVRLQAAQIIDLLADLVDCKARVAALEALTDIAPGEVPACDGCPLPAIALVRARLRVLKAFGFPPTHVAEICRRTARR
jgi:hypothetical protein